jgi:WD40 repeat protein
VNSVAFSRDGKWIVSASDDETVHILNASSGQQMLGLQELTDLVRSAIFSNDCKVIVSASDDKIGARLQYLQ